MASIAMEEETTCGLYKGVVSTTGMQMKQGKGRLIPFTVLVLL